MYNEREVEIEGFHSSLKSFSVYPFNKQVRRDHENPLFFLTSSRFQEKST